MKKSCVIFDMDGLKFDTQCIYDRAFHDILLRDYGLELPDALRLAMMGRSGDDLYQTINRFFPGIDAPEYVRRSFAAVADRVRDELVPRPGLYELLPWLREQGVRLGLASGSDRAIVESNLRVSGLKDYFPSASAATRSPSESPTPRATCACWTDSAAPRRTATSWRTAPTAYAPATEPAVPSSWFPTWYSPTKRSVNSAPASTGPCPM